MDIFSAYSQAGEGGVVPNPVSRKFNLDNSMKQIKHLKHSLSLLLGISEKNQKDRKSFMHLDEENKNNQNI